ncbi:MAG: phosphoglucosamine mutase [Candidatus Margulisbacteria bacterium]|nr:phosphoglucosamine mutase [Candidatus Margulisiibacteriota bacterium]
MALKVTISGVRGIYGQDLNEKIAFNFGKAFGQFIFPRLRPGDFGGQTKTRVVVGADTRNSSPSLREAMFEGLKSAGCTPIDIGICPTPTVQIMVRQLQADGGVMITASHNPKEWNGLKFIRPDGIFLNSIEAEHFINIYYNKLEKEAKEGHFLIEEDATAISTHLKKVLDYVNVDLIKKKKFKVVLDSANGAGCVIGKKVLEELGCEVIMINGEPKGDFNRNPEPIPKNITELCAAIKKNKADIGFAQDADADRLAIVNEKGEPIGEDNTLALASDYILSRMSKVESHKSQVANQKTKIIVTNLSTSRVMEDIAKKYGGKVVRTKIGEVNVSEQLKALKAAVGGEGNGGVMIPAIGFGRDSIAGMAILLEYLASSGKTVSELVAQNPKYVMYKTKIDCSSDQEVKNMLVKVKEKFKDEELNELDGVKAIFKDGNWLHVRPSNTEAIIRIISEAPTEEDAKKIAENI